MPLFVAGEFLEELGLTVGHGKDDLLDKLEDLPSSLQNGIFDSLDAKAAVIEAAENEHGPIYEIYNVSAIRTGSVHYHVVELNGNVMAEFVDLSEIPAGGRPGTDAEKALAIYCSKTGVLDPFASASPVFNKGLAIWHNNVPPDHKTWLITIFNGVPASRTKCSPYVDVCKQKSVLSHTGTSKVLGKDPLLPQLLSFAVSEPHIKWKFLGYYRIFENGYLHEVFAELQSLFFQCTDKSLDTAKEQVKNEINLFVNIVSKAGVTAYFESIFDTINKNINNRPLFHALLRYAQSDDRYKKFSGGKFQQGVFLTYQLRCSIVHAGDSHLVFERFPTAEESLLDIITDLELAVIDYLGIQLN